MHILQLAGVERYALAANEGTMSAKRVFWMHASTSLDFYCVPHDTEETHQSLDTSDFIREILLERQNGTE
jgi:CRISPR/Cas system type I-B associated protein Csh2 (Cas7 group RAMP superfamily)